MFIKYISFKTSATDEQMKEIFKELIIISS